MFMLRVVGVLLVLGAGGCRNRQVAVNDPFLLGSPTVPPPATGMFVPSGQIQPLAPAPSALPSQWTPAGASPAPSTFVPATPGPATTPAPTTTTPAPAVPAPTTSGGWLAPPPVANRITDITQLPPARR